MVLVIERLVPAFPLLFIVDLMMKFAERFSWEAPVSELILYGMDLEFHRITLQFLFLELEQAADFINGIEVLHVLVINVFHGIHLLKVI